MADPSVGSSYLKKANFSPVKILLPYLWPPQSSRLRGRLVASLFFILASKLVAVGIPLFYKEAVNLIGFSLHESFRLIIFFLAAYGTSRAFSTLFSELKDYLFAKIEQRAVRLLSVRVFNHLNLLSLRFHLDRQTGAIVRTLERGSKAIETFFKFTTFSIFPILLEVVVTTTMITYLYGISISAWVCFTLLLYVVYTIKTTTWRAKFLRYMHDAENRANQQAVESLLNYETVKYFGNEELEQKRFETAQRLYEESAIKNKIGLSILNTGQGVIISVGLIGLLWMVALKIKSQTLSLGDLVLINTYLLQLYAPLNMLGFAYREIKRSLIEMDGMFSLLQEPIDIQGTSDNKNFIFKGGEISFEKVSFSYSKERKILKDISFQVPAGQKVALVGLSGSGKSTIARLLFRFYDVTEGEILIDGQNVKAVTQDSLRAVMGVVPQDTVLFNDTILYNIQYGNPHASFEEVQRAAQAAYIHDFILSLPQGYNTMVGERGLKLSGGEKQRVSIARTLLKKPKIFLFDEATSSLDTMTEKQIQNNLNEMSKGCSTLIIAHRLSTIIDAHKIIVLSEGEIIERGTHQTLLKKKGVYAAMWKKQSEGKNEEP
jgi:ABC-type transport system involved in Fe-S cluster assembly fused permease/ATPase subunit